VLEKRVLCRISGRKGRKSQEKGEKLYTEELRGWCSLPNNIRLKKSMKKVLARYWHAHMKEEMYIAFCWEALKESEQWFQIETLLTSCQYMSVYTVKGSTNTV